MIRAEDACLVYHDQGKELFACRDLRLEIGAGEFVGILGPSGSGKSSLLYLLSGLKTPSLGRILYDGQSLGELDDDAKSELRLKRFGFVFQQPYLLGYLSAIENVLTALPAGGEPDEAAELLSELGLGQKLHRKPHELSGGERQRVCVARALFGKPKAIFADEPTASLDHENGIAVVELLRSHRGDGALIMVTHDQTMLQGADRIVRIVDGLLQPAET